MLKNTYLHSAPGSHKKLENLKSLENLENLEKQQNFVSNSTGLKTCPDACLTRSKYEPRPTIQFVLDAASCHTDDDQSFVCSPNIHNTAHHHDDDFLTNVSA